MDLGAGTRWAGATLCRESQRAAMIAVRRTGALALALVLLSVAAVARESVVAVTAFTGEKQRQAREHLVKALKKAGVDLERGPATDSLGDEPHAYARIARKHHIERFVVGRTEARKTRWTVTLTVRSGTDGSTLGEKTLQA